MIWIYYLLEANLYLAAFYGFYYLIFRGETYYQLNRIYLLASTALAFAIPVIQLGILNPPAPHLQNVVVTTINSGIIDIPMKEAANAPEPQINYFLLAYGIIVVLLLSNFFFKIYKLIRLSRSNKTAVHADFKLVELPGENNAFSFFNYLFISPGLTLSSTIIHHELIHIKQKHSWDIIYLELLKIINWFNPVVYLLQNSIKEVHEFIADRETLDLQPNASVYTDFLINNAYGINEHTLTNTFFNKSLLKKRIMMLHQKRSGSAARLKYLLILPLIGGLLCASTLAFTKTYRLVDLMPRTGSHISLSVKVPVISGRKNATILYDTSKRKFSSTTGKGYKYEETGYLIKHKTNFRVIITEKNGEQKEYYKNSATPAELKLLKDKYGYAFPSMDIFDVPPPPPPVNLKAHGPPPPPAPPHKLSMRTLIDSAVKTQVDIATPPPPPPPSEVITTSSDEGIVKINDKKAHTILYTPDKQEGSVTPLIIVNGQKYNLKEKLKPGQYLYITASDSTVVNHRPGTEAREKWGAEADNGMIELYGKTSVEVK
jgi:BlaR1 peptidase M56